MKDYVAWKKTSEDIFLCHDFSVVWGCTVWCSGSHFVTTEWQVLGKKANMLGMAEWTDKKGWVLNDSVGSYTKSENTFPPTLFCEIRNCFYHLSHSFSGFLQPYHSVLTTFTLSMFPTSEKLFHYHTTLSFKVRNLWKVNIQLSRKEKSKSLK